MRRFYLYKNNWGYYMAVMIDPVSGLKRGAKSTHTKDKVEATVLAAEWAKGGMPEAKSHSRAFLCPDSSSVEKPASKKSDIKLCEFLINFWDYDKSDALQRSFARCTCSKRTSFAAYEQSKKKS